MFIMKQTILDNSNCVLVEQRPKYTWKWSLTLVPALIKDLGIPLREGFKKKKTTNLGFWLNLRWHLPTFVTWAPLKGAIFLLI